MGFPGFADYKASGIEDLNEIPKHWDAVPLKHVAQIDNSGSYGTAEEEGELTLPVATTAQIDSEGRFQVDSMPARGFSYEEAERYTCRDGDTVANMFRCER